MGLSGRERSRITANITRWITVVALLRWTPNSEDQDIWGREWKERSTSQIVLDTY